MNTTGVLPNPGPTAVAGSTEATATLSAYLGDIVTKLDRALVPVHAWGMAPQAQR